MLQTKKPSHQFNSNSLSFKNATSPSDCHFKRCDSQIIQETRPPSLDLDVEEGQQFICFQCANNRQFHYCKQCKGTGLLKSNHPLVKLVNQLFNVKFLPTFGSSKQKSQMVSTKTSSNSNISDSQSGSDGMNSSIHKSPKSGDNRPKETHKNFILDLNLSPLQPIIKQESNIDEKCQKCNICHYEFDDVKYTCSECENYNVCEQCYRTKRISHTHQLKKMHSINSQKTTKNQDTQNQHISAEERKNISNEEIENSHSEVDKLSLKSEEPVGQIFKGMRTRIPELFPNQQKNNQNKQNDGFSELRFHQNQNPKQSNKVKLCQNCVHEIQDCYWICQTCAQKNKSYEICKQCYDEETYEHPKNHHLGLNFFSLDESFFEPQYNFLKQEITEQTENLQKNSNLTHLNKNNITPSITLRPIYKPTEKTEKDLSNIGLIGHTNIFTGFQTENENENYKNQIISPIPKSISFPHSFRQKKPPSSNLANESDAQIIADLMTFTAGTTPKKSVKNFHPEQKENKDHFGSQSKLQSDQNIIMDLGNEQNHDYQVRVKQLCKSENKQKKIQKKQNHLKQTQRVLHKTTQINPETSIMDFQQQDYFFTAHFCNLCGTKPIKNIKYHCLECEDFDLCLDCYQKRRDQHWHSHFREDDGKLKLRRLKENKQKIIKKAIEDLNRTISPTRRSMRYMRRQ